MAAMNDANRAGCIELLSDSAKSTGINGRRAGSEEWTDFVATLIALLRIGPPA
jgi:hypothetical protein